MHRCHDRFLDADPATNNLDHWSNTVGRTTCTSDDIGVAFDCIDAMNHSHNVITLCRGRKNDILSPRLNMLFEIFPLCEYPGAFQDNIHSQVGPGKISWISFTKVSESFTPNIQGLSVPLHGLVISSIHRIVLKQVDDVVNGNNIVDRYQFQPLRVHDNF